MGHCGGLVGSAAQLSGLKDPAEVSAVAQIQALEWDPPYATGAAIKNKNQIKWRNQVKSAHYGIPVVAQQFKNLTSIHEDAGSIPVLTAWV